ncbi:unnamed protein product [Chilo suppressalis]|uniref:BED-type domain-containing protein n=1 Tax=Chilo suppressalis TaxID=168631 RepID=A0ABN8BAY2_CHISP|nr:unnamed protein product [Chilo suppressalis]
MFTKNGSGDEDTNETYLEEETVNGDEPKDKRRSRRSGVWEYFDVTDEEQRTANCQLCSEEFSYRSTSTNLVRHLQRKHGVVFMHSESDNDKEAWDYFTIKNPDKKLATCKVCTKDCSYFTSTSNLLKHVRRAHGIGYMADDEPDDEEETQNAEPMEIYLDEVEGNVIEKLKSQKPLKKVKRVVIEESDDTDDGEITYKKRYVKTSTDSLDKFGSYLVSLLRQLPKADSNRLQADFVKQIMNCQSEEGIVVSDSYVTTIAECKDDLVADSNDDSESEATSPVWSFFEKEKNGRARCVVCCVLINASTQDEQNEKEDEVYTEVLYIEEPSSKEESRKSTAGEHKKKTSLLKVKPTETLRARRRSSSDDEGYRRKRPARTETVTKTKRTSDDEEIESFGTYVVCLLKKLPRNVSMKVQRDIINLIMNANLNEEKEETMPRIIFDGNNIRSCEDNSIIVVTNKEGENVNQDANGQEYKMSILPFTSTITTN